jgi:hypothetical protein
MDTVMARAWGPIRQVIEVNAVAPRRYLVVALSRTER